MRIGYEHYPIHQMNHSRFLPEALNVTYKGRSPGFPNFIPLLIRQGVDNGS
jgi:hypothetical protein